MKPTPEIDTLHEASAPFVRDLISDHAFVASGVGHGSQCQDCDRPRLAHSIKIIPKPLQSAIIPDRKQQLLRKIGNAQSELGRLNKLLDEIRQEVLSGIQT